MSSKVAAQIFHLPYRGFAIRKWLKATADGTFKPAAEYNSAIQQSATLRYVVGWSRRYAFTYSCAVRSQEKSAFIAFCR